MKRVPITEEQRQLKVQDPRIYETYWKVMYHFCIYLKVSGMRG